MNAQPESRAFSRILVALDSSRASLTALESAALLAEAMQYELVGLFVEDPDLMTLASLPFSREVRRSGVIQNLDPEALRKDVARHAAAARYAMQQVAVRRHIRWSFRSIQGDVRTEVSAAADILCVSRRSSDRYRRQSMGNPVRMVLERQSPVLVAGQLTDRINKPIAVIVDRTEATMESVRLAGQIAARAKTGLVVLEFLPLEADVAAVREQIRNRLPAEVTPRVVLIGRDDPCHLLDSLRRNDYSLVLYGVHDDARVGSAQTPAWLDYVTDAGDCPLLLIPEPAPA